jgi:beta-fructofuranosidase
MQCWRIARLEPVVLTSAIVVAVLAPQAIGSPELEKEAPVYQRAEPFGETIEAQRKELAADPFLLRFKKARDLLATDPFCPRYHFLAPENHIGDPNGLCYWHGRWYLFYQFRPRDDPDHVYWGHAVSEDLIHWEDLPIALHPTPGNSCFSGNALVEHDRVLAMYHATNEGNQIVASSDPLLLNWKRISNTPGKVTIPFHPQEDADGNPYRVWDPFLYKEEGTYYSISGVYLGKHADNHKRKAVWHLFSSSDLLDWTYKGKLVKNDVFTEQGDDGSCSYFWPLGSDKRLLIFFSHRNGSQHLLGTYCPKRQRFVAESHAVYHAGPASAAPDPQNPEEIIAILTKAGGRNGAVGNWNPVFTLPRRLSLGEYDIVHTQPAGDFASLRYDIKEVTALPVGHGCDTWLTGIRGKSMEMEAVMHPGGSSVVELQVLCSPDGEECTTVRLTRGGQPYNRHGGERWSLAIDTYRSTTNPGVGLPFPQRVEFLRFGNEPFRIHVFVDMSVVEVFVNEQAALVERAYPERPDSGGVRVWASGDGAVLHRLTAWQMKSIYEKG